MARRLLDGDADKAFAAALSPGVRDEPPRLIVLNALTLFYARKSKSGEHHEMELIADLAAWDRSRLSGKGNGENDFRGIHYLQRHTSLFAAATPLRWFIGLIEERSIARVPWRSSWRRRCSTIVSVRKVLSRCAGAWGQAIRNFMNAVNRPSWPSSITPAAIPVERLCPLRFHRPE